MVNIKEITRLKVKYPKKIYDKIMYRIIMYRENANVAEKNVIEGEKR